MKSVNTSISSSDCEGKLLTLVLRALRVETRFHDSLCSLISGGTYYFHMEDEHIPEELRDLVASLDQPKN